TRYELVVEASGQAAYDYCVATGGIIWGKSIKKVLGYSSQEMTGGFSQWKEMLHPGDREATLETLYAAEKDCAYWDHEYRMRHKKGEYRWVRDRGFFVRGEKGTVERQLGMIEDINDRKRNEIELKSARELVQRWNKELEHRVEERTEELRRSQGQLIQAEKLSSVGQLSAGVAHELNSPLTGLLTMLGSYLKKTDKNKAEYNEIREMIEASKHMARIVKDLGTFARETDDVFTETDLNEVINSTLNFIPHLFRKDKKTVRLKKELNTSIPAIKGNESRLRQVVLNLITNSCDAMPEGGKLTIRTGKTDGGKGVMMTFEDTGKGISEENIKKVFEPFFTTKQPGEGVGLGLSIVHGIIATHSGRIKIESEKGKRTKFTVIFPAAKRRRNNNGKKRKDTDSR
ncbi:MAG: PAS domain-containing protein, partial [Candidatus Omnitrophica bacterium]|nr:PAS domain-containing protein [Candidatus Omnitrophota bacterium]